MRSLVSAVGAFSLLAFSQQLTGASAIPQHSKKGAHPVPYVPDKEYIIVRQPSTEHPPYVPVKERAVPLPEPQKRTIVGSMLQQDTSYRVYQAAYPEVGKNHVPVKGHEPIIVTPPAKQPVYVPVANLTHSKGKRRLSVTPLNPKASLEPLLRGLQEQPFASLQGSHRQLKEALNVFPAKKGGFVPPAKKGGFVEPNKKGGFVQPSKKGGVIIRRTILQPTKQPPVPVKTPFPQKKGGYVPVLGGGRNYGPYMAGRRLEESEPRQLRPDEDGAQLLEQLQTLLSILNRDTENIQSLEDQVSGSDSMPTDQLTQDVDDQASRLGDMIDQVKTLLKDLKTNPEERPFSSSGVAQGENKEGDKPLLSKLSGLNFGAPHKEIWIALRPGKDSFKKQPEVPNTRPDLTRPELPEEVDPSRPLVPIAPDNSRPTIPEGIVRPDAVDPLRPIVPPRFPIVDPERPTPDTGLIGGETGLIGGETGLIGGDRDFIGTDTGLMPMSEMPNTLPEQIQRPNQPNIELPSKPGCSTGTQPSTSGDLTDRIAELRTIAGKIRAALEALNSQETTNGNGL